MRLTVAEAEQLVCAALTRCGATAENAAPVARALVRAEIDGQAGHGLRRVETYGPQALSGKVDGAARPALTETAAATARIDVGGGFAYAGLELACDWLAATAPRTGVAAAALHRSHHCGVAGHWVERLAEHGLVALMFANTPAAMPPWGGTTPLFGTNPIAFAAPADPAPVVVDLSLSKVARGKIMAARQKGEPIPEGWAVDSAGRPTTDAAAALGGAMLPLGDAKGAALALMVEVLAASLTGANPAFAASSFFDAEGPAPGVGQLLIALSPAALGGPGFPSRLAAIAAAVASQPGARLPGAGKAGRRARAATEGFEVDDAVIRAIEAAGPARLP